MCSAVNSTVLSTDDFGHYTDPTGKSQTVKRFTWKNSNNIEIQVISYGGTITSIKVPDRNGNVEDIVTGFNDMEGYQSPLNRYFGATIGRVANRIANSQITIDGQDYKLSANSGKHQLHGGFKGFDKVNWDYYVKGSKLVLSYMSRDGEEGFPGAVLVNVTFELTENNEFIVDYKAITTKPTYVNLTNHSYFNLAGHDSGASELYKHLVNINADAVTEVESGIPTGKLLPVADTVFDLQVPKQLGDIIHKVPNAAGFDHNFCINRTSKQGLTFIARVQHPPSGRVMEIYCNQPGVQFYTSNVLPERPEDYKGDPKDLKALVGKGKYYKHGAFCLETQIWPDAIHHKNFPNPILLPGDEYHHTCIYKFWIKK